MATILYFLWEQKRIISGLFEVAMSAKWIKIGRQKQQVTLAEEVMYICVDFDGTVVDHRYPDIGEPVPVAINWLKRLQLHGAKIILFTMRSNRSEGMNYLQDAVQYLKSNGIELYGVNRNPDQDSWTSSPKAYGEVYVDDAAIGCPLIHPKGFTRPCVDWKKVGPQLEFMLLCRR
jgi:hypothetical protein